MFVKILFRITCLLLTSLLFAPVALAQSNKRIIYIPLDNRPVSLGYVDETLTFYGNKLILPPAELIASNQNRGNPDKLMQWLIKESPKADIAVIATDSLVYGGLVASRTHQEPLGQLLKRAQSLNIIKQTNPRLKIYAFSTIMRTPMKSFAPLEPKYYEQYGSMIFRLTQLMDQEDLNSGYLNSLDRTEKKNMIELIDSDSLADWFSRRKKNMAVHSFLLESYAHGSFDFYTIGKDDSAALSQTHYEARTLLNNKPADTPADFRILPGVDQLGLLLITRSINADRPFKNQIFVQYAEPAEASTISRYSDQPIYSSVLAQLEAVGAELAVEPSSADFTLAVYTPEKGVSRESADIHNAYFPNLHSRKFAAAIADSLHRNNKVVLVDIAYVNGATNGLMNALSANNSLGKLTAYSGWNTVDNSIGYALSQGILSLNMKPKQTQILLKTRLLDDWIYQSNVRFEILNKYFKQDSHKQYNMGNTTHDYEQYVAEAMQSEAGKIKFLKDTYFTTKLPWNRMFEIYIKVK